MNFIRYLPPDSACARVLRDGMPEWRLEHSLLDDLRMVWTGDKKHPAKPHPLRPKAAPRRPDPKRASEFRRRQVARRKRLQREG